VAIREQVKHSRLTFLLGEGEAIAFVKDPQSQLNHTDHSGEQDDQDDAESEIRLSLESGFSRERGVTCG